MILWWDLFDTLIFSLGTFLVFVCFCCVNLWIIHVSLLLPWWFVDDSLKKHWRYSEDFNASIYDFMGFNDLFSETLTFHRYFVDDSLMIRWRDICETLINSMETFLIFIVFASLTSETLIFHCSFIDDLLMTLWRNFDDTTKFWMQTVKIIEVYNVIIIRMLMFLWCLID